MKEASHIDSIINKEEHFHDGWAGEESVDDIDVIHMMEAPTAPEYRYMTSVMGDLKGKRLLDLGCGLGEASVYYALKGAEVTSVDISSGMLDFSEKLAAKYKVTIRTVKSSAESFSLNEQFDIIYAGSVFHHADLNNSLKQVCKHLKPGGKLISLDPIAYNPIINIYRRIASSTRTEDEHPIRVKDIKTFKKHFKNVKTTYFWFTALYIFMHMYAFQRKDPNKVRYWKDIIINSDDWKTLFPVLQKIDRFLLMVFPPLKYFCLNIVVEASDPV